jgi:hypothetical protein
VAIRPVVELELWYVLTHAVVGDRRHGTVALRRIKVLVHRIIHVGVGGENRSEVRNTYDDVRNWRREDAARAGKVQK